MKAMEQTRRAATLGALLFAIVLAPASWSDVRDQAKRLHDRIAGVPPDDETLVAMALRLDNDDALGAALLATDSPQFYSVTLKDFAAPWTNRDRSVFVPLDDYIATIIGVVRDNLDFRDILSEDLLYVGSGQNIPDYSDSNNAHYQALQDQGVDLKTNLQPISQSSVSDVPTDATAGVLTTRSAAKAYFIDGTNRAMFRFTLVNHLCTDLEPIKDISRAPDRIRQDVSRSPGGDSRVFLNNCIGCHSGMDPMAQAFAYYDYTYDPASDPDGSNGRITYNSAGEIDPVTQTRVVSKYFNNALNFEYGYATPDDHWTNYWREGQNSLLGWELPPPGEGNGAKSMGRELAHSEQFAQCQVKKVFQSVCLRPPEDADDHQQIKDMTTSFRDNGYNLRRVFAESAVYCMGD